METVSSLETIIPGVTGQEVYPRVIAHVLKHGALRSPRGHATLDAGMVIVRLGTAYDALPLSCGRDLSTNVAAAEAVQLVGGFADPELLLNAAPGTSRFLDGHAFHGAYGERIGTQMVDVLRKLREDLNTRQAIVTLWDQWRDNLPDKKDYPCTVSLQFEVRDETLCMTTIMRSNDVWLGLPYDMFQFTQLQLTLARCLGLPSGWYRHVALSMHMYCTNIDAAQKLHRPVAAHLQPTGFGKDGQPFSEIMSRARNTTQVNRVNLDETRSEAWYRERFASYMGRDVDERGNGDGGEVAL